MPKRNEKNPVFVSKSNVSTSSPPPTSTLKQKLYSGVVTPIRRFFIRLRELFLGRTDKQLTGDKPSYLGKKMILLLGIFLIFSFTLFAEMNADLFEGTFLWTALTFFTFDQPYVFGIAVSFTFIELSLINCNDKIHEWFFGKLYVLKQLIIISGLMVGNFYLAIYLIGQNVDLYSGLLILAMFWLIFQSIRIFNGAQTGATKYEAKISERYSPFLYFIAIITPFIILGVLTFLSWVFRFVIVVFTLDNIGDPAHQQTDVALEIYRREMGLIMPMIYTGLLFIFILMIAQMILSRKRGATKRAGAYDNFSFGLIAFVMFLYSIYNISLYLFLDETFLQGFNTMLGSESHGNTAFFIEYLITIFFLLWIVLDLHKQFEKGILFFTKDGLIIFLLGAIIAQTTARLGIATGIANVGSTLANIIKYDYMVLPWVILIFLGFTIVIYWIKPQEMSMFLHMSKSAVKGEDKGMENILRFLKREFIRRGEMYIISPDIISSLRKITSYPSLTIWSLIHRLNKQYIDVHLREEKDDEGNKVIYFDFLPITQRYQKSKDADKRAQAYLQNYFAQTLLNKPRKKSSLTKKKLSSSKQSDVFIQSLSFNYAKKVKDQKDIQEGRITKGKDYFQEEWINREMDQETKSLVYEIVKKEYMRRLTRIADYPNEFRFRISDIATTIETATAVPVGRVFALLHSLAAENWNFQLSADFVDVNHPDDRLVEFLPIDDWEVYNTLRDYRPGSLREIHVVMQTWFDRNIHYHREELGRLPPLEYKDDDAEFERSYRSRWFAQTMGYFSNNFDKMEAIRRIRLRYRKLQKAIAELSGENVNFSEKEYACELLRAEYLDRIRDRKNFPETQDLGILISEIGPKLAKKVKIPLGRVFTMIETMGKEDCNVRLNVVRNEANKKVAGEKRIEFFPIDDFKVYAAFEKYRPEALSEVKIEMQKRFLKSIRHSRTKLTRIPPLKYRDSTAEMQRSDKSRWFGEFMQFMNKNYSKMEAERKTQLEYKKVKYLMKNIIQGSSK